MILFIGHDASRTGAPRSLLLIARGLHQHHGVKPVFLLKGDGPLVEEYRKLGPIFFWMPHPPRHLLQRVIRRLTGYHTKYPKRLLKRLRTLRLKAILNNTVVNGDILDHLRALDVPIISRIPELEYAVRLFDLKGLSSKVFANSDHFIAVSHAVKNNLISNHGIPDDRISVVHGAIESLSEISESKEEFRQRLGLPTDAIIVGGCGSLLLRKGVDIFIQVARQCLTDSTLNFHFVWVGGDKRSGNFIEWSLELEKLGIAHRVLLIGETDDVSSWYSAMDVFLMPSREDPFPLVNLEAAAHGLPIIGFKGTGGTEEFVDSDNGMLVNYGDVKAMTDAIIELGLDPGRRELLGRNGATRAAQYTIDKKAALIWTILQDFAHYD